MDRFADRAQAGAKLAEALARVGFADPVVLALPCGGVPVAEPVAKALSAPLDLLMVRKLGVPGNPELAAGAVVNGAGHDVVFNEDILAQLRLSRDDFDAAIAAKLKEIEDRRARYLAGRAPVPLAGRDVIVVDDGIATGATVRAALTGLGRRGAASLTLAVPLAPAETLAELRPLVDRVVCLSTPEPFYAVGQGYLSFNQVDDAEVAAAMARTGP